jgi:hypothetical protein
VVVARKEAAFPTGEPLDGMESTCRLIVHVSGRQKLALSGKSGDGSFCGYRGVMTSTDPQRVLSGRFDL